MQLVLCATWPGRKEAIPTLSCFGSTPSLEIVALMAATVFPILLLQTPSKGSKTKDHIACLERRLVSWANGNLDDLVREGMPKFGTAKSNNNLARNFSNLMFMGKCKAALDILSHNENGGILHLDDPADANSPNSPTVRDVIISKHPPSQPAHNSCIIPADPVDPHHIIFNSLDANAIRSAALKVKGAAGPYGLDAHGWRRLCTCFKGASRDLCESLASVARRICSSYMNPTLIAPLLSCRLIALNKNPGVRPIGISDTARRIIAKAARCQQLCVAGLRQLFMPQGHYSSLAIARLSYLLMPQTPSPERLLYTTSGISALLLQPL